MTETNEMGLHLHRAPAPLACRIAEDIVPRDSVLAILQGMDEWYNGYEFLWRSGGWTTLEAIPAEYHDTFRVAGERADIMRSLGFDFETVNYVNSACIMQAARWFTGFGKKGFDTKHQALYYGTARALALSLGHDDRDFQEWDAFEGRVITYNDQIGRSFAGIKDVISAAIIRAKSSDDVNITLSRADELMRDVANSEDF